MSTSGLSLAQTSTATKNGAILGREGLNSTSIASVEHKDFGGQETGRMQRT
jgi:hypothetical protein